LKFECYKCGKCCLNLLQEDKGVLRGLTLLPEERNSFLPSTVKPAIGHGKSLHSKKFKIIAYQLTQDTCPHLRNDLCEIYPKRPASCRQYPFSLKQASDETELIGLDLNCPSLLAFLERENRKNLRFEEKQYAEKLLRLELKTLEKIDYSWFFDLENKNWVNYREIIKK
jgi:Fe-S-cluster containining protein